MPFGEKLYGEDFVGALVCGDSYAGNRFPRNYEFGDQYILFNGDGTGVEVAYYTYEERTLDYDAGAYVFETDHVISWTRISPGIASMNPLSSLLTFPTMMASIKTRVTIRFSNTCFAFRWRGAQVVPIGGYSWFLSADEVQTLYGKDVQ